MSTPVKNFDLSDAELADFQDVRSLGSYWPASAEGVEEVLQATEGDDNGRSPWVWVRLFNGDLMLATFPSGDTYERVCYEFAEADASRAMRARAGEHMTWRVDRLNATEDDWDRVADGFASYEAAGAWMRSQTDGRGRERNRGSVFRVAREQPTHTPAQVDAKVVNASFAAVDELLVIAKKSNGVQGYAYTDYEQMENDLIGALDIIQEALDAVRSLKEPS